jgi:peptide deformylase
MTENEAQAPSIAVQQPIITPTDQERWPLLEVPSQLCSIPVNEVDATMIGKMDAILDHLGDSAAGLAAVQIGYPKRIFLLREGNENRAFINPEFVAKSPETKRDGEACLSLPGFGAVFKRPKSVTLRYYDLEGKEQTETFTGFWARAICHEMDHLEGTLIAHHLEHEVAKQSARTKFGMQLTPHRRKVVADRRAKNKRAKAARKANRG